MTRKWIGRALLMALVSFGAQADEVSPADTGAKPIVPYGWSGSAQLGASIASGNSTSAAADGKFAVGLNTDQWKHSFYLEGEYSRAQYDTEDAQGNPTQRMETTAKRYDVGLTLGYKLNQRSYIYQSTRYGHDRFAANLWDAVVSAGYGYIALNTERSYLYFEAGPGYRKYRPADVEQTVPSSSELPAASSDEGTAQSDGGGDNSTTIMVRQASRSTLIGRGLIGYTYLFNSTVSLSDTLLIEAGTGFSYYKNNLSLVVAMTKKLALTAGYELRYNSDAQGGTKSVDSLLTTNLRYTF